MGTKEHKSKQPKASKKLKLSKAAAMSAEGFTQTEIAEELGMHRCSVNRLLHSDEIKSIVKTAESSIHSMYDSALTRIKSAIENEANPKGEHCAIVVLKSIGALKDKVDVSHTFPKPTVIEKSDGSKVILGAEEEE